MASIDLRPLEDVASHIPTASDRSAVDAWGHGRAESLSEARLEGIHGRLVLARHRGEEAPKDRCECRVRDGGPVVRGVGRTRCGVEIVQLAAQAPIPGHAGHKGLVERDPRVPECSRGHGRTEPRRLPHQVEGKVEPPGSRLGAETGYGMRLPRTQAQESRRTCRCQAHRPGCDAAQSGQEFAPRQPRCARTSTFSSGHLPPPVLPAHERTGEDYA